MALLEYNIQYDEKTKTSKVTCQVLEVNINDRISFKSNYAESGIEYQKASPFNDPDAPKAGEFFPVGAGTKGPFTATVSLNAKTRLNFKCGEEVKAPVPVGRSSAETPPIYNWWKGNGTPPDDGGF
jgi:hypothetical protein